MKQNELLEETIKKERHDYKGPHCCMTMHYELLDDNNWKSFLYNEKFREYYIKPLFSKQFLRISYCVLCGTKLPKSIRTQWFKKLKQEYNIDDPEGKDKKRVPKEFLSDAWWNPQKTITNYQGSHKTEIKQSNNRKFDPSQFLYCCDNMEYELCNTKGLLFYVPKFREYAIKIPNSTVRTLMDHCPFCGIQFPESVRDNWFDILENEYHLESPMEEDRKKVPKEFWTDEWWKERNL